MSRYSSGPEAKYPLTVFDKTFERTTFVTGWLVQGTLKADALAVALGRLTEKWRMLSGRLEIVPGTNKWQISVPLGPLPTDYRTYALTESTSDLPLSHYVKIPLETSSESLPQALFIHPQTPRANTLWVSTNYPLTCWHITHFPSRAVGEPPYSCIGFARSHGMFDGVGAGAIMRALVAEMHGKEWDVPPLPLQGTNENPIERVLEMELARGRQNIQQYHDSASYSVVNIKSALWMVGWQLRERHWRGAKQRIFIIPKKCIDLLVDGVKSELRSRNQNVDVTTGDVLTAWLMKSIYMTGSSPETLVHCSNFGSFRDIISQRGGEPMAQYPHNAFVPLPYPVLTVESVNALSLPEFTRRFCMARHELSLHDVVASYQTLVVSNVSASRILETDWSPIGSKGTVCGYRFAITPNELVLCNNAYISGRLSDSSTVLDVTLSTVRMQNLTRAVDMIIAKA
ncbi:hypothetical protein C8J57DRAFT_1709808 [Mycena rebaudengoi]|nr:hypothetical protein C8J57DRAFT_1709808 [Mycena rebaudengoi]